MNEPHGGLKLGGMVSGVGESEAEQIHQEWASYPAVEKYLETHLALVKPSEPEFACPVLRAEDLTTNDNKAYTEIYAQRVAWFGFLSERKAEHDAIVLEIEAEMTFIETRIRNQQRKNSKKVTRSGETKAPPVQEMEDVINSDTRHIELQQKLVFHRQVLKRLNARVESLDREIRLTSRQVEIRRQDFDNAGRGGGTVRQPSQGMRPPGSYGRG
jgi:hypothetical protein